MLESYFDLLAGRMRAELVGIPQAERLGVVARLLSQEGYMAEALVEQGAGEGLVAGGPLAEPEDGARDRTLEPGDGAAGPAHRPRG